MTKKYVLKSEGEASMLRFERYAVISNGSNTPRILTLVGESHIYSKEESEIGRKLVSENDIITQSLGGKAIYAYESTKKAFSEMKANDLILTGLVSLCQAPYIVSAMTFSGRNYPTIEKLLADKGELKPLEKNPFARMSSGEKLYFLLSEGYLTLFLFPFLIGKTISDFKRLKYKGDKKMKKSLGSSYNPLVDKRNEELSDNIVKYATEDGVSTLLAVVGRAHLNGVIQNLKKDPRIKIEKMNDIGAE